MNILFWNMPNIYTFWFEVIFHRFFHDFLIKDDKKNAQNQIMYTFFQKIIRRLQFSSLFWDVFLQQKSWYYSWNASFEKSHFLNSISSRKFWCFFCFFLKKTYHFRPSNTNMKILFWKFCIMFTIVKIRFFKPKNHFSLKNVSFQTYKC